jgi:hypothetical protein
MKSWKKVQFFFSIFLDELEFFIEEKVIFGKKKNCPETRKED